MSTTSDRPLAPDEKYCHSCGEMILKKAEFCPGCGERVSERLDARDNPNMDSESKTARTTAGGGETPSFVSAAGDVLFNKSLTRQLIDLELLVLTGFTWIFFLLTEVIYHRWRQSRGEAHLSQYSHAGGVGEGYITKAAKVIFWGQFVLIGLFFLALIL